MPGLADPPSFERGKDCWQTEIALPSRGGYLSCKGDYGAQNSDAPTDGCIRMRADVDLNKQSEAETGSVMSAWSSDVGSDT
jgi:hypothetical protein